MAATSGALTRKIFVVGLLSVGCLALLLFCSRLVVAEPVEASYYGPGFEGNLTANGEVFDSSQFTAAHKTLEFGTKLIVSYEGRSAVVRINDRGPYIEGRDLDLSQGAAEYLGLTAVGVAVVDVETADPSTPVGPYAPVGASSAARAQPADGGAGKPESSQARAPQGMLSKAAPQKAAPLRVMPQKAVRPRAVAKAASAKLVGPRRSRISTRRQTSTRRKISTKTPPATRRRTSTRATGTRL